MGEFLAATEKETEENDPFLKEPRLLQGPEGSPGFAPLEGLPAPAPFQLLGNSKTWTGFGATGELSLEAGAVFGQDSPRPGARPSGV